VIGEPRVHLEVCGSTNDELAARAAKLPAGAVLVADAQTAGRGRGDHRWHSPPGDLYASILLRPAIEPARIAAVSLVAGLAVARALRSLGVGAQLRWPNDVVVGAKKIAGVLADSSSRGGAIDHVIVGIGVNVAAREFPPELAGRATSIAIELGDESADRDAVLDVILASLPGPLERFSRGGVPAIRDEWEALWRDRGAIGRGKAGGREVRGQVIGLTETGALELDTGGERVALVAGSCEIE
jgi:BirA family biotin operon repressor/biotin-[acetyl-CoA-carboxylase] ligase